MRAILAALSLCLVVWFAGSAQAHNRYVTQAVPGFFDAAAAPAYPIEQARRFYRRHASPEHRHAKHHSTPKNIIIKAVKATTHGGIITVQTAAHISIRVAADFAPKIKGFIQDLVTTTDYRPQDIGCYSPTGHIANSLHHIGEACDFDQTGWNETARVMYSEHVRELAHKWGLRDGCDFHHPHKDCGHIDAGFDIASARHHSRHRYVRRHYRHYARAS